MGYVRALGAPETAVVGSQKRLTRCFHELEVVSKNH